MSSSYIVEPQSEEKKDDTLIIVVNDDGTLSVDQATLQNLIMTQSTANVSVVRLGQTETDMENGDITLTVDPPPFTHPTASSVSANASTDSGGLVDPFMEMDPEQLERLETALQSEEAKQILGENVTAMLDMLSVEEQQNTIRYSIQLDHCYTSRLSPNDPIPRDPLPIVDDSPDSNDVQYIHQSLSPRTSVASNEAENAGVKSKIIVKSISAPLQNKINRPIRKATVSTPTNVTGLSRVNTTIIGTPKLSGHHLASRNITNVQHGVTKAQSRNNEEEEGDEATESSTESSESEPPSDNDNDSDFGPRQTKRANTKARGGRKGLTTRGGSMTAVRRRGQNKQLDMEQVRRLDMEMAAAVNAMKTPEKDDKSERFSPTKNKRQIKTLGGKKKEESSYMEVSPPEEAPYEKPLQTTNQVKANLINANMIKGDMILTKPGQGRSNPKVTFVQKHIPMKPNEFKNIGLKKPMMVPKGKSPVNQTGAKFFATKDGKLVPIASKTMSPNIQVSPVKTTLTQQPASQQSAQVVSQGLPVQQQAKISPAASSTPLRIKLGDIKREKRKSDTNVDLFSKGEENSAKFIENKALDGAKKIKKDTRKVPGFVADSLGPALFSTPDIIRRVGSNSDGKSADNTATPTTPTTPSATVVSTPGSATIPMSPVPSLDIGICAGSNAAQNVASNFNKKTVSNILDQSAETESQLNLNESSSVMPGDENEQKSEIKTPLEELQPSLDPAPNTASSEGIIQPAVPSVSNHVSKNSGIEGEEQLFATLEMEANKPEEDLLAEALLLQEELTDDLTEHSTLVDATPSVSESLASNNMLIPPLITSEQELTKPVETATTTQNQTTNILKEPSKKSKDDKEPIQIIRGGRVITLPPIEAPATRSKRLQAKTEISQKTPEPIKKIEKFIPQVQQLLQNKEELKTNEEEDDDDEEDEEDNSDSEDDPDRLWCICKRPHNNRFMICCDVCEDWFHGKCVHVSKAMGQQMEEKGIEWVCPNCLKKKAEEEKAKSNPQSGKQRTKIELVNENSTSQKVLSKEIPLSNLSVDCGITPVSGTMQCVVCKKEARNSSIYCSDACILAHAQETLTKDKPVPTGSKITKSPVTETKAKPEARVVVLDRKSGKLLTGADAPTRSNLRTWLKENPTFEVIGANNINTLQIGGKLVTQIQTSGKTTKITQPIKVQTMPKMIYTKVVGSKQTVLAPNKKITIIPATQQQANVSPSNRPTQMKQTIISTTPGKSPIILKTTMPKSVVSAQVKAQAAAGSPKPTPIKKQEIKPSPSQSKLQIKPTPVRKPEAEPIRLNIRKTLTELLSSRIKETEDLKLTDEEIADLAFNIELEMYKYFKDTGSKYKAKYRSLVFNIKDTKNLTLFRKIADRSLTPDAVVRLSPDEMASQELAEWREKETKHQLEMIKKNELDLMAQAKSIVVKTHKGEQIIENDGGIDHVDPKTPVQDIVTALNSGDSISSTVDDLEKDKDKEDRLRSRMDAKKSKGMDERRRKDKERGRERDGVKSKSKDRRERSHSRHRRSRDRDRSKTRDKSKERKSRNKESRRDKDREREKDKDRDRNKDRDKTSRKESRERGRQKEKDRHKSSDSWMRNRSESRESKDVDKKEEDRKKETEKKKETSPSVEKPIEDRLWRHIEDEATTNTIDGNDSDISDREPSSTVTIKTPDINEEPERDKEQETDKESTTKGGWRTVWRGFVNMVDVAKFFITAQEVSGNAKDLMDDLPDTVDVVGRISHDTVWDYISKMKRTGSKEILVIRLTAANDEEKIPYITLYSYLNSRSRLGVVGNVSKNIKDFYIMPFSSQSTIPPVLLPLTGPGFEEHRPHLLLGIIVRNKKKRLTAVPSVAPTKTSKKESDRSYTPPLVSVPKEKTTSPPPSSSPMLYKTVSLDSTKEKPATVTQMTLESLNKAHIGMSRGVIDTATICKIVPELSSKIDLTSSPGKVALDDDGDEPYSPGEMDDDMNSLQTTTDSAAGILSSSKNSTELQRKMDELNRQIEEQKQQIEEQKQQIQSISSSFLDETTPTLPGLGLDPPSNDCEEAYSPSDARSFTPPPPGITKFAQPILDKVSDITIPPNLQEILANVKRQESSKVDPYLPSKPSASFLPSAGTSLYASSTERYSPSSSRISQSEKALPEAPKESKSTLSTLSDLDLIRKAEEELAAVAAATAAAAAIPSMSTPTSPSSLLASPVPNLVLASSMNEAPSMSQALASLPSEPVVEASYKPTPSDSFKKTFAPEQPKPPGLEDEDFPAFPSIPPTIDVSKAVASRSKASPKTGIVLNVKRNLSDDGSSPPPAKVPRTKSRWGQGPSE
ncbi:death-inducer obliterator 1 [Camponotus floridanus]|uniref:death-inducer obliterator 1 n=1 Tax=Camponotus floridanus TaxID=104421 RepID=UPI000DC690AA|nr:death-inducer obliterator 1 [Camponotus floridanus]XP_011269839.2 death-inducer obliterator 1 [Camponotus floridanus]